MSEQVEVRKSSIEGKGLFAAVAFKKGEHIQIPAPEHQADEKIMTDNEFAEFQRWCISNGKQWDAVSIGGGMHRVGIADRDNDIANYGNHSCDPNTDKNHIALRDIEPGEELTIDYAQFSSIDWQMECNCGAVKCQGTVRGTVE